MRTGFFHRLTNLKLTSAKGAIGDCLGILAVILTNLQQRKNFSPKMMAPLLSLIFSAILASGSHVYHNEGKIKIYLDMRPYTCESIVQSLPILVDDPFWNDLLNQSQISDPKQIRNWLRDECMERFEELLFDHQSNIQKGVFEQVKWRRCDSIKTKQNLFVLALESIVYQRESLDVYYGAEDLRQYNVDDLHFSLFPSFPAQFIIYRQYLMNLIMHNIHNSDFMIYAESSRGKYTFNSSQEHSVESYSRTGIAIHSVIMLELYYQYAYALMHSDNRPSKELRFRTIIAKMPFKLHKSIGTIQQMINLAEYQNIFIIDDSFEAEWKKTIPYNLLSAGIKFHSFNIPSFPSRCHHKVIDHKLLPEDIFRKPIKMRANDKHLSKVNTSKSMLSQTRNWRLFGNIEYDTYR